MTPERRAPLEALGTVLRAHKFRARVTCGGLYVENPDVPGCRVVHPDAWRCGEEHPSARLVVRPREDDAGREWVCTSWGYPLAEADHITDVVMAVKTLLDGKPGVTL